jgi:hypothetical protein
VLEKAMKTLKSLLAGQLQTGSLEELIGVLRDFRSRGGSREMAYKALAELREERDLADREDRILELMDVVRGFCSAHMLVWRQGE